MATLRFKRLDMYTLHPLEEALLKFMLVTSAPADAGLRATCTRIVRGPDAKCAKPLSRKVFLGLLTKSASSPQHGVCGPIGGAAIGAASFRARPGCLGCQSHCWVALPAASRTFTGAWCVCGCRVLPLPSVSKSAAVADNLLQMLNQKFGSQDSRLTRRL